MRDLDILDKMFGGYCNEDGGYVDENGTITYFNKQNLKHRENGPAVEWSNGTKFWYKDGVIHREDGPAYESKDGTNEWYLNGIKLTEEEFNHWKEKKKLNENLHSNLEEKPVSKKVKI